MVSLYRDKLKKYGQQDVRDDLAMARMSAAALRNPEESYQALKLYQQTEKELFGGIGEMNPGEQDLTTEGENGARREAYQARDNT